MAIIIAGIIIALAFFFSQVERNPAPTELRAALAVATPEKAVVAISEHDPSLGSPTAPVTIVLFSNWQCPYCTQWHRTVLPELQRQYLNTNRARLVFKDFPLSQIHPQAQASAEAAHCADAQQKFWEYAQRITQPGTVLDEANLRATAAQLELNLDSFDQCMRNHEQAATVAENVQAGIKAGVTSIPTFVINGTLLEGAESVAVLGAAITGASR